MEAYLWHERCFWYIAKWNNWLHTIWTSRKINGDFHFISNCYFFSFLDFILIFPFFFFPKTIWVFCCKKRKYFQFEEENIKSIVCHFFKKLKFFSTTNEGLTPYGGSPCVGPKPVSPEQPEKVSSPESGSLERRPRHLYFHKPFRWFWGALKCENPWVHRIFKKAQWRTEGELLFWLLLSHHFSLFKMSSSSTLCVFIHSFIP